MRTREFLAMLRWEKRRAAERIAREDCEAADAEARAKRAAAPVSRKASRLDWTGEKKKRGQARDARLVAEWLAKRRR
jgi:hypothetical protein